MYPYNNLNVFRGLTKMFRVLATRGASAFRGATLQVTWCTISDRQMKKLWNITNRVNLAGAARPGCPLFQADVLPTRVRFWIWCQVSPPDHCSTRISIGVSVLQSLAHFPCSGTLPISTEQTLTAGSSGRSVLQHNYWSRVFYSDLMRWVSCHF